MTFEEFVRMVNPALKPGTELQPWQAEFLKRLERQHKAKTKPTGRKEKAAG